MILMYKNWSKRTLVNWTASEVVCSCIEVKGFWPQCCLLGSRHIELGWWPKEFITAGSRMKVGARWTICSATAAVSGTWQCWVEGIRSSSSSWCLFWAGHRAAVSCCVSWWRGRACSGPAAAAVTRRAALTCSGQIFVVQLDMVRLMTKTSGDIDGNSLPLFGKCHFIIATHGWTQCIGDIGIWKGNLNVWN